MSDIAVKVENLGKCYQIGQAKSGDFRDSFGGWMDKLRGRSNGEVAENKEFWALKDINFEIKKGEAVGIIGRNGAGKSTLLKILSRITEPTKGRFEINGRVSSLLEVGTGFHPELSGRENIYLNGTILGMKRLEIKAKFDAIVAFSGVEKFIDTPVKHYSSGMKVRLAFSVAAHLEPEILIVDEVLAVGDAEFQKKCLGKMDEVSKNEGRTVIFVSHNMGAVKSLCDTGILLSKGGIRVINGIEDVIQQYLNDNSQLGKVTSSEDLLSKISICDEYLEFIEVGINQGEGFTTSIYNSRETFIYIKYQIKKQVNALQLFFDVFDMNENLIFRTLHFENSDMDSNMPPLVKEGRYLSVAKIPHDFLIEGNYKVVIRAANMYERMIEPKEGISFEIFVEEAGKYARRMFQNQKGLITPQIFWKTQILTSR